MDQDDADRVMANLSNGTYKRIDSGHVIHLEELEAEIRSLNAFLLGDV